MTPSSQEHDETPARPRREVRAAFDAGTIVVYQAFSPAIAESAVSAGRFVPPFRVKRMTWIKPSFLWMMYRSGWATKPDQERVLAVTLSRDGFEWALAHSCLTDYDSAAYADHAEWLERKNATPVRIQWDPERSLLLEPLEHRAIQIGLGGVAARRYAKEWIVQIMDVTWRAHAVHNLVSAGALTEARELLPDECPYPLTDQLKAVVGGT